MGFQCAAFGFVLAKHPSIYDLILFTVKSFQYQDKKYDMPKVLKNTELKSDLKEFVGECDCFDLNDFESQVQNLVYYDDIVQDMEYADQFTYKENSKIKVSNPTSCNLMIWIAKYDDESEPLARLMHGSDYHRQKLNEKDMADLFAWKRQLVDQNRMDSDVFLEMTSNCCG